MHRPFILVALMAALSACTTPPPAGTQPLPISSSDENAGAAVIRRPAAEPVRVPPAAAPEGLPTAAASTPAIIVPPNTQYVCVSESNGVRQQTSIEFSKKVAELCRRHPEMGPCKYEREVCRRSNGRVYTANGVEITRQTEAEYDKKVMRVVFKSN